MSVLNLPRDCRNKQENVIPGPHEPEPKRDTADLLKLWDGMNGQTESMCKLPKFSTWWSAVCC